MAKVIEAEVKARGQRFAVVVSRFNDFITKRLLDGCLKELKHLGVKNDAITVIYVPGSFEIPLTALKLAKKKNIDAVICLGCVIEGETLHFDVISRAVTNGIAQAALQSQKPVIFGVLTAHTTKQAYERSKPKGDNKGCDAAQAAVSMANLFKRI